MKSVLGKTTRKDVLLAIRDVDRALAGKPSSYSRIDLPIPATSQEVKAARRAMHATQRVFAAAVGVSVQTVKSWESGDRKPEGPATKLIRLLRQEPSFVAQLTQV